MMNQRQNLFLNRYGLFAWLISATSLLPAPADNESPGIQRQPVDWVDPMSGSADSRWMLFPGPTMPFGLVNLSPDNQDEGWKGGHDYRVESISGFSHIHSWVMGGLLTMPATGDLQVIPGSQNSPDAGYRSRYRHESEIATAGYYAVTLDDYQVRAELTTTKRTGFQRYTFPKTEQARILFDLKIPTEYGYRQYDASVTQVSPTEITGHSTQYGRGINCRLQNDYTIHFVAQFSKPMTRFGGWISGNKIVYDEKSIQGDGDLGAFVEFSTSENEVVLLKTGVSLVSIEQARLNLEVEQAPFGWDFDACRANARDAWNKLLKTIEVVGRPDDMKKFYSNMYRVYSARADCSDVNGKYRDMYEKEQQLADTSHGVYGCDAMWNTFWNINQVWNLATPGISRNWVKSMLEIYDRGGWLPKGPTGIEYSGIMVASHQIAAIVAAYQHGIRDFDAEKAYQAILHQQTVPGRYHEGGGFVGNRQLEPYLKHGYVPVEAGWRWSEAAPASNTLEYAYDDWCVAQMAQALGKQSDYERFSKRAAHYRNVFDADTKFARPRKIDGSWLDPFDPLKRDAWYAEGNAWQYTWFVPHDVAGLIHLMEKEVFHERLVKGFERARSQKFNHPLYVNVGNQPNMQAPWLFNYSGSPWLTQKWTRLMLDEYFGMGPVDGYPGDEDQGQMGGWFVMTALGLFQTDGGCSVKPFYEIGSPLFDRAVIHLDSKYHSGGTFTIETRNNSSENVYIQSASLDGKPLHKPWFFAADLQDGGALILEMGPQPNKTWGSQPENAPPSMTSMP